ncbi:flocculation protein FLO11 [Hyalella azteca]|uniref:Flocculation protein FLO11 n=1 Tax=Hyalella azteca TaxID=294128 RepID=A0A8B7N097_HYAAZ|nr:flocculation protein FLO11 [Hyalella azteca]
MHHLFFVTGDCEGVGRCLVEQARRQGSQDNITAVVVFLRPVDVLMEEEAARRQAGEIPEGEMDPSWLMKKDAAPSTIYEIFSNNVGTFNPDSPTNKPGGDYNPFSPDTSATVDPMGNGEAGNGSPAPPYQFASNEQVGHDYDLSAGLPDTHSADPTMEDVESALAELDSLPDGDIDPSSEHYDNQEDKEIVNEVADQHSKPVLEGIESITVQNGDPSSPSSPRSVEGFVTSVELNPAQEQYSGVDLHEHESAEQPSGPFSVYVSSSPEPASLDPLANAVEAINSEVTVISEEGAQNYQSSTSPVTVETSVRDFAEQGVEIVHAQSVVEVEAPPSPTEMASSPSQVSEEQFPPQSFDGASSPSPAFTQAPLNDLMSTSMILEKPISDAPEDVEEMMQYLGGNNEVLYNNLQEPETAQVLHISSDSDRILSPEATHFHDGSSSGISAAQVDAPVSPIDAHLSPLAAPFMPSEVNLSPNAPEFSPRESSLSPEAASFTPNDCPSSPPAVAPRSPVSNNVPSPDAEELLVEQMNQANLNASYQAEEPVHSPEPITADLAQQNPVVEEMSNEFLLSDELQAAPVSDVMPSTPIKAPMIDDRPVSPIHTPKADIHPRDEEIISEIVPPTVEGATATKKAPVKPAPRTAGIAARSRLTPSGTKTTPTTAAKATPATKTAAAASAKASPATSSVKPGTPRPTARTTPGGAVRSSATTAITKITPTTRATARTTTITTRTTTTPTSRPSSATSTRTTTTTTTTRTPLASRTTTPSASRSTPSNSTTRTTPASAPASRPTPSTRTTRPGVTPSSARSSATPSSATRTSSRPSSAATTPTTARKVPITRRPLTTAAKDSTDSKSDPTTTTKNSTAARVPLVRKPLSAPRTTAAKPAESEKKDIKNSTNKLLSSSSRSSTVTRTTTRTTTAAAPTHKPTAAKTTTTTRKSTTTITGLKSRTASSVVAKSKTASDEPAVIDNDDKNVKEVPSPETEGEEIKQAQEETSVEVLTKEVNEIHLNGEAELITTTTTVEEVLINGNGEH